MPIARRPELKLEGAWIGPALNRGAAQPLGRREVRVHSVFRLALYLELSGSDYLACLTGPEGEGIPNAIALAEAQDFLSWPSAQGALGILDDEGLFLGSGGPLDDSLRDAMVRVDLRRAARAARESPPIIAALGSAYEASVAELSRVQAELGCDLTLAALRGEELAATAMGRALARAALALGAAARRGCAAASRGCEGSATRAVGGLLGLGTGLTPSGDDFLCGFLFAAAAAAGPADAPLREAVDSRGFATGEISRSFLRCAARGYFPRELHGAASAVAADDGEAAAASIRRLCRMGHSSGADTATGFLYGLSIFAPRTHFIERGRRYASKIRIRCPD